MCTRRDLLSRSLPPPPLRLKRLQKLFCASTGAAMVQCKFPEISDPVSDTCVTRGAPNLPSSRLPTVRVSPQHNVRIDRRRIPFTLPTPPFPQTTYSRTQNPKRHTDTTFYANTPQRRYCNCHEKRNPAARMCLSLVPPKTVSRACICF